MNNLDHELPRYMDDADLKLQFSRHHEDMKAFRLRLIEQVKEFGQTNCGMKSVEEIDKVFGMYRA